MEPANDATPETGEPLRTKLVIRYLLFLLLFMIPAAPLLLRLGSQNDYPARAAMRQFQTSLQRATAWNVLLSRAHGRVPLVARVRVPMKVPALLFLVIPDDP